MAKCGDAKYISSLGYLSQIKDSASGTVYWQANTRDAELHLLTQTAGNGVNTTQSFDANTGRLLAVCATPDAGACDGDTANYSYSWDTIGNLTSRADTYQGYTENFCYDALNRLTNYALGSGVSSCTASGTGIVTKTVAFDSLGNITSKSDVGTYSYPASGSAHPHAVSSITGTVNGVVNPSFTYDLNGNMTAGDGRSVTPTSFNMASAIVQGSTSLCLVYDSDHARITQVQTSASCAAPGSGATTTTYLNGAGAMEELYTGGATSTWRDYIVADGGIVALRSTTSGTVTMAYFNGDHLGSTSVLTNASGAVTERDSYDAWGRRRNANGTDSTSCSITGATTRGYTGQEMLDPVCAINLNARLYDPTIGRVMSADPTVPDALNGQSFNRYSYVENGPLSAIDLRGFKPTNEIGRCTFDCHSGSSSSPFGPTDAYPCIACGGSLFGPNGDPSVAVYGGNILGIGGGIAGDAAGPGGIFGGGWSGGGGGGSFGSSSGQWKYLSVTTEELQPSTGQWISSTLSGWSWLPSEDNFDVSSLFTSPAEAGEFNPVSKKDPSGKNDGQCSSRTLREGQGMIVVGGAAAALGGLTAVAGGAVIADPADGGPANAAADALGGAMVKGGEFVATVGGGVAGAGAVMLAANGQFREGANQLIEFPLTAVPNSRVPGSGDLISPVVDSGLNAAEDFAGIPADSCTPRG